MWQRFMSLILSQQVLKNRPSARKDRMTGSPCRVSENNTNTGDFFRLSSRFSSRETCMYWCETQEVKTITGISGTNSRGLREKNKRIITKRMQIRSYCILVTPKEYLLGTILFKLNQNRIKNPSSLRIHKDQC